MTSDESNEGTQSCPFASLSGELVVNICSFVDTDDLLSLLYCCRRINSIAQKYCELRLKELGVDIFPRYRLVSNMNVLICAEDVRLNPGKWPKSFSTHDFIQEDVMCIAFGFILQQQINHRRSEEWSNSSMALALHCLGQEAEAARFHSWIPADLHGRFYRDLEVVDAFVNPKWEYQSSFDLSDREKKICALIAIKQGNSQALDSLFRHGFRANRIFGKYLSAHAASYGRRQIIEKIYAKSPPQRKELFYCLREAVYAENELIARYLTEEGADPRVEYEGLKSAIQLAERYGMTELLSLFASREL